LHRFNASTNVSPLILARNENRKFCCHATQPAEPEKML
jgi:hypothetical protein